MESLKLEKFTQKRIDTQMRYLFGGDKDVMSRATFDGDDGCTYTETDGYYDDNGNGRQDRCEKEFHEVTKQCCNTKSNA